MERVTGIEPLTTSLEVVKHAWKPHDWATGLAPHLALNAVGHPVGHLDGQSAVRYAV
jgi:hypothetical protein